MVTGHRSVAARTVHGATIVALGEVGEGVGLNLVARGERVVLRHLW